MADYFAYQGGCLQQDIQPFAGIESAYGQNRELAQVRNAWIRLEEGMPEIQVDQLPHDGVGYAIQLLDTFGATPAYSNNEIRPARMPRLHAWNAMLRRVTPVSNGTASPRTPLIQATCGNNPGCPATV